MRVGQVKTPHFTTTKWSIWNTKINQFKKPFHNDQAQDERQIPKLSKYWTLYAHNQERCGFSISKATQTLGWTFVMVP